MKDLYLCGAGNAECVRLALTINRSVGRWNRIVLLDDDETKHGRSILDVKVAGPFSMLERVGPDKAEVANLVARTTVKRCEAARKIASSGVPFASLVHPAVDVLGVELGEGIIVYRHANLGAGCSVGEGSVVFMGGIVGHGCRLDKCCIVAPNAVINARVKLGEGAYVGTNSTILPDLEVGAWATVAVGSVVMRNVEAGTTVMGNPARVVWKIQPKALSATRSGP